MNPIQARFRWTDDEFREAARNAMRPRGAGARRRAFGFWIAVAAILFGLWLLRPRDLGGRADPPIGLVAFLGGMVVGALLALKGLYDNQRKQIGVLAGSIPDWAREVDWTIDADGFSGGTSRTRTEFGWDAVTKVVDADAGFLIYVAGFSYHWLPRHAFGPEAEAARFALMARDRGLLAGASPESEPLPER